MTATTGRTLALLAAVLVAMAAAATPARAATPRPVDFYGLFADDGSLPEAARREALERQARVGVGLLRTHVHWDAIETAPGSYDWRGLDALVADAADRGLRLLPVIAHAPEFFTSAPPEGGQTVHYPPDDPRTMARFAGLLVGRYGPGGTFWCTRAWPFGLGPPSCRSPYLPITAWQVWNEPDWPAWWGRAPDPAAYVRLLREVAPAIRAADPTAEVVLAGLTRRAVASGFLERLYAEGAAPYFDTLAVHPYGRDVADVVGHVRDALALARRLGHDPAIRITEYGWATGGGRTPLAVAPECQAALLHAATLRLGELRAELRLRGIVQFMWNDRPPRRDIWPYYAGMVRVDGTAKPALAAFTAAVGGRPVPAGSELWAACPPDRWDLG